ncbi:pimeloyl-ACP methyl ester carboxylesterase [Actinoplanes tereljensis]|uniref:Alpha/beta hydrolase n=1 Tax=Paractinoplanes tereljensis TaxID=571912 RepID=A0A919NHC7_9ACTN|nr:alpha/beta hydrolase [Actinoplanes tereljensis]GIF18654.1 alpha/beta hydrolase [Actinoplanes tereljensis]
MSSVDVLTVGQGPGLVVLPGATRRARHYAALAAALSSSYTVHVVERRGRGRSPAQGSDYGLDREVADTIEVLSETGSRQVFGHSYGGLVALHVALRTDLDRVIAYEPAVSVDSGMPFDWLPRYEELLAAGRPARAMVHFLHSLDFMPGGPLVVAAVWAMQRLTAEGRATREVLPTVVPEMRVAREMDSDGGRYAGITAPALLLGGGRSPAYIQEVLPLLVETIPHAKLVRTPEFDHNAPDLGAPAAVADLIRA